MTRDAPGIIRRGSLYRADEAQSRLRLGNWAWREMRRAGLPVIYQGKHAYVLGDDVLDYFKRVQQTQNSQ